jgi:hypothetical protein
MCSARALAPRANRCADVCFSPSHFLPNLFPVPSGSRPQVLFPSREAPARVCVRRRSRPSIDRERDANVAEWWFIACWRVRGEIGVSSAPSGNTRASCASADHGSHSGGGRRTGHGRVQSSLGCAATICCVACRSSSLLVLRWARFLLLVCSSPSTSVQSTSMPLAHRIPPRNEPTLLLPLRDQ